MNFLMFKLVLEKAEKQEIKLPTSIGSWKKQESSRKTSTFAKAFDSVDHNKLWIPDHLTCLLRNLYAGQEATVKTRHGITDSKLGKEYIKAVYCHPAYLTYMQSTSCEMPGWMKHTRIKIARRNINNFRYTDDTTLMAESGEALRASWWNWKRRVKKLA